MYFLSRHAGDTQLVSFHRTLPVVVVVAVFVAVAVAVAGRFSGYCCCCWWCCCCYGYLSLVVSLLYPRAAWLQVWFSELSSNTGARGLELAPASEGERTTEDMEAVTMRGRLGTNEKAATRREQ